MKRAARLFETLLPSLGNGTSFQDAIDLLAREVDDPNAREIRRLKQDLADVKASAGRLSGSLGVDELRDLITAAAAGNPFFPSRLGKALEEYEEARREAIGGVANDSVGEAE